MYERYRIFHELEQALNRTKNEAKQIQNFNLHLQRFEIIFIKTSTGMLMKYIYVYTSLNYTDTLPTYFSLPPPIC